MNQTRIKTFPWLLIVALAFTAGDLWRISIGIAATLLAIGVCARSAACATEAVSVRNGGLKESGGKS